MNWYRFDWKDFISDALLRQLNHALGVRCLVSESRDELAPILEGILTALGGPPIVDQRMGASEREQVARDLLHQAICHGLKRQRLLNVPGYLATPSQDGATQVQAVERVRINEATRSELENLPHIGPTVAESIVRLRRQRPFADLQDFIDRVPGIGQTNGQAIATAVTFESPAPHQHWQPTGDFQSDLRSFVNRPNATLRDVVITFERLLALVRQEPSPIRRLPLPAAEETSSSLAVDQLLVWPDSVYYSRLKSALQAATRSIDICMFHIAMPKENHPTKALLDALITAHQRGLSVRVLVDADRPEDHYLSTVINERAVGHLRDQGVPVRQDSPAKLLHSKFVLVDDEWTIIGSHNWSAGSFFQMDDLTLAIRSTAVWAAQRARFEQLWNAAI